MNFLKMADQNQLESEIELQTNPSFIVEKDGIFYPIERISWDGNHIYETYNKKSGLELGLDIIETPIRTLIIGSITDNDRIIKHKNMLDELRNLAQISGHDFYSHEENSIKYFSGLMTFKPRLFRRTVNN